MPFSSGPGKGTVVTEERSMCVSPSSRHVTHTHNRHHPPQRRPSVIPRPKRGGTAPLRIPRIPLPRPLQPGGVHAGPSVGRPLQVRSDFAGCMNFCARHRCLPRFTNAHSIYLSWCRHALKPPLPYFTPLTNAPNTRDRLVSAPSSGWRRRRACKSWPRPTGTSFHHFLWVH